MIDEKTLQGLYLRDPVPIRLGNLASSVKRLGYLIQSKKPDTVVYQLFRECKLFSAWTAPEVNFETKTELGAFHVELENWQNNFHTSNKDALWRAEIATACEKWAERILDLSGLLKTGVTVSVPTRV